MTRPLLRHLRRCRAFMVLAICAWLTLSSVAWAMPRHDDCCPAGMAAMSMQHAAPDHGTTHVSAFSADGCCTHAPASVPDALVPHVLHAQAGGSQWLTRHQIAPQPVYDPPLRPPVA